MRYSKLARIHRRKDFHISIVSKKTVSPDEPPDEPSFFFVLLTTSHTVTNYYRRSTRNNSTRSSSELARLYTRLTDGNYCLSRRRTRIKVERSSIKSREQLSMDSSIYKKDILIEDNRKTVNICDI